jgi:type I restriction enzyme S subunit
MFGDPVRNEKGWDVKKLLEVSRVFTGGTPARSNPEYFTGRIPWVTSVALNNIFINDSNAQGYITEDAIAESSTKKVKEGSLCFGIRVGVGKCSITQTELCINQDIAAITDFSSHCTPLFLRSVIKSFSNYFESIQKGATIQGVTTGDLKQLDIILPELSVQYVYDEKLKNILSQETSATHNKENVNALFLGILSQHFS